MPKSNNGLALNMALDVAYNFMESGQSHVSKLRLHSAEIQCIVHKLCSIFLSPIGSAQT